MLLVDPQYVQIRDLWGNLKPRVSPDWTGPKPIRDRDTFFKNIFGSGGIKNFGPVWVKVFFFFFYQGIMFFFFFFPQEFWG